MLNSFRMDAACRVQLQGPAGVPAKVYEPTYVGWARQARLVQLLSIAGVWMWASRSGLSHAFRYRLHTGP